MDGLNQVVDGERQQGWLVEGQCIIQNQTFLIGPFRISLNFTSFRPRFAPPFSNHYDRSINSALCLSRSIIPSIRFYILSTNLYIVTLLCLTSGTHEDDIGNDYSNTTSLSL